MVMKCEPSLMTMCLPWRTILNPAFSNACTARNGEVYATKQVRPIFVEEAGEIVVVTVYTYYFDRP
jgi:ABC-type glucose/galactose transport system permease subunit